MTKSQFTQAAKPLTIRIGEHQIVAEPKSFSTGSVGFFASGKIILALPNGETVKLQASFTLTAVGSKEWQA